MRKRFGLGLLLMMLASPLVGWGQFDTLSFSAPGGFYDEVFALEINCGNPDYHIRFTTDGNEPTKQSKRYVGPISLDERMFSEANIYAKRNCEEELFYKPESILRCIIIRASVFDQDDNCVSTTITNSYFIKALGCDFHGLPVVSLCANDYDLFDEENGIFVPGRLFNPSNPKWTGNYYQRGTEWERPANFEFYELDNTGVNQQCGLRTHGGNGRRFQQKTLKIYARKKYGYKCFQHKFFEELTQDRFKHLVLRPFVSSNGGCEDHICNRIAHEMGLECMADRPSVLFLNGEYWGIYYVKEKPDEHYLEDHYGIDPREINLQAGWWASGCESGSPDNYKALATWMAKADLTDEEQYAYAEAHIDIDNFIDYYLLELFIANFDWPVNNVRFWQQGEGKFRWMFYDGDSGLEYLDLDVYGNAVYEGEEIYPSFKGATLFFRRLLKSSTFQKRFADRFNQLIATTFAYENTKVYYDDIKRKLQDEAPRQFARFSPPETWYPKTVEEWLGRYMKQTELFLKHRSRHKFLSMPAPKVLSMDSFLNVTNDRIPIRIQSESFGADEMVLYDLKGKKVYSVACVLATGNNVVTINTQVCPGMYLITVGQRTQRVLIN